MKLLLTQVYLGRKELPIYPIGLARLASRLKQDGHEVIGLDMNVGEAPMEDLENLLKTFQPDIVGFSLRNIDTTQFRDPFLYWKMLEKCVEVTRIILPEKLILAGGSGFSLFARELMDRIPGIDFGFFLESEDSLTRLLRNPGDVSSIPGIFYRENNRMIFSGPPQLADFGPDNQPDMSLFPIGHYAKHPYWH